MPPMILDTFSCATHEQEPSHSDVKIDHEVWQLYEQSVRQTWRPTPSFLVCIQPLESRVPCRPGNTSKCPSRTLWTGTKTNTCGHEVADPANTFRTLLMNQQLSLPQGVQPSTRDTNWTRSDRVLHVSNTCIQNQSLEPTAVLWMFSSQSTLRTSDTKTIKIMPFRLLPRTGIKRMFQVAFSGIGKLFVKNFPTKYPLLLVLKNSRDRPKKKMVCVVVTS